MASAFCHIGFFFLGRNADTGIVRIAVVGKLVPCGGNLFYFVSVFFGNNAGHKKRGFNVLGAPACQGSALGLRAARTARAKYPKSRAHSARLRITQVFGVKIKGQQNGNALAVRPFDAVTVF